MAYAFLVELEVCFHASPLELILGFVLRFLSLPPILATIFTWFRNPTTQGCLDEKSWFLHYGTNQLHTPLTSL